MRHFFSVVAATLLLSACATAPKYLGHKVTETRFEVDGGKTITLPITSAGALPAENDDYKIEGAGILAHLEKGSPSESTLTRTFLFVSKKSIELESVTIELVTDSGGLEPIVNDNSPTLSNKTWMGRSASTSMTKDQVPWLYLNVDSTFLFKFTITDKKGETVVMYQPSIITSKSKNMYLRLLSGSNS